MKAKNVWANSGGFTTVLDLAGKEGMNLYTTPFEIQDAGKRAYKDDKKHKYILMN